MSAPAAQSRFGSARFERIYARSDDPWSYRASAYERAKYAATLAALPSRPLGRVLEVGCSIGVFTRLLAPRCERLVAIDFSTRALALARAELAGFANVELAHADFPSHAPDGEWDAVVCSEVLYYLDAPALRDAIAWLRARLERDASGSSPTSVLAVSWRGDAVDEPLRGDDVHDTLASELARWHVLDGRGDGYRLDRFDGAAREARGAGPVAP